MITITDKEFQELTKYIKEHYGINLKEEKRALVTGRLQKVLYQKGFQSFSEFYDYVLTDKSGNAITLLVNQITTNHTFFMREADHFEYLKNQVLPYLVKTVRDKDLRIWSAGCSSGEEPYTIAMFIDDFFGKEKVLWNTKILATDISSKVLEEAVRGVYKNEELVNLPNAYLLNYFKRYDAENSILTDSIRSEIIFRKFNLMDESFPFRKKFHVIFCRNVMIYFDNETKQKLVNKFYDSLEYGGYLFIGHSESINREGAQFSYVMPAVYRKV